MICLFVFAQLTAKQVRPICRATGTLEGHTNSVLCVQFDPTGTKLASSSGDHTVRFWDIETMTPKFTCNGNKLQIPFFLVTVTAGHRDWVGVISWSPDSRLLASGAKDGDIRLWEPETGKLSGTPLSGHRGLITSLAWEPWAAFEIFFFIIIF